MHSKRRLSHLILLSLSLTTLSGAHPAWANQWTDMFKTLLLPPNAAATTDPVAAHEADINNRIIDAINSDKLSPANAQSLKMRLDVIRSEEANYRSQNQQLDSIQIATLNNELRKVDQALDAMIGGAAYNASGTTDFNSIESEYKKLQQRIVRSLASGRLTIDETLALKSQYDRSYGELMNFKRDGMLSADESNRLNQSLSDLKRSLAEKAHDQRAWGGIDGQQLVEAKRIEDGISSGQISRQEYTELRAESDSIASTETAVRANGLQMDDTLALANRMWKFNQHITAALNNQPANNSVSTTVTPLPRYPGSSGYPTPGGSGYPTPGGSGYPATGYPAPGSSGYPAPGGQTKAGRAFDLRQADVLKRIDDRSAQGKLSADDARDLRANYRRLEQLEASYRADGQLTDSELANLQGGLDNIVAELSERTNVNANAPISFPEIGRKERDIRRRIDDATTRGQLSSSDGQRLISNLNWITSVEANARQSDGRLDQSEADNIQADLDRLNAKIDRLAGAPPTNDYHRHGADWNNRGNRN